MISKILKYLKQINMSTRILQNFKMQNSKFNKKN